MDIDALWLTLRLALSTTAVLLGVALPIAWWIALKPSPSRAIVQALVSLPLVLPPTVIGFYLLVALGPLTPIGRLFTRLLGHPLAFSFAGLLAGSLLYSLPFAVQPLISGFSTINRGILEASVTLGASPAKTFFRVALPLARPALLTATVLTFTHTVGEFGVVLMLGGNIPGATRTLSISLYDQVQDFNYAAANRTALLLLGFSMAALLVIYLWPGHNRTRQASLAE
jgi:molybdate transport system permease protein